VEQHSLVWVKARRTQSLQPHQHQIQEKECKESGSNKEVNSSSAPGQPGTNKILQWLRANGCNWDSCTTAVMYAAAGCHSDVYCNGCVQMAAIGTSARTSSSVAFYGHLAMVAWTWLRLGRLWYMGLRCTRWSFGGATMGLPYENDCPCDDRTTESARTTITAIFVNGPIDHPCSWWAGWECSLVTPKMKCSFSWSTPTTFKISSLPNVFKINRVSIIILFWKCFWRFLFILVIGRFLFNDSLHVSLV
jgi:hypothetical protein